GRCPTNHRSDRLVRGLVSAGSLWPRRPEVQVERRYQDEAGVDSRAGAATASAGTAVLCSVAADARAANDACCHSRTYSRACNELTDVSGGLPSRRLCPRCAHRNVNTWRLHTPLIGVCGAEG